MLSRCPRNFNQGPAIEIWSVVHFPLAFIKSRRSLRSVPSHAGKGSSICSRLLSGSTFTCTPEPSAAGAWKPASSTANPFLGSSSPVGGSSFTCSPLLLVNVSVNGLKLRSPAIESAVTNSGEPTNAWVLGLPSFLLAKLRL